MILKKEKIKYAILCNLLKAKINWFGENRIESDFSKSLLYSIDTGSTTNVLFYFSPHPQMLRLMIVRYNCFMFLFFLMNEWKYSSSRNFIEISRHNKFYPIFEENFSVLNLQTSTVDIFCGIARSTWAIQRIFWLLWNKSWGNFIPIHE